MTPQEYKKSIITGQLQLPIRNKSNHFFVVYYIVLIPIIICVLKLLHYCLNDVKVHFSVYEIVFVTAPFPLALFVNKLLKDKLKFKIVKTKLSSHEAMRLIKETAISNNWTLIFNETNILIAKTHPSFLVYNWGGEQVTVLLDGERVLVNSIGDTDNRQSLLSNFRDRGNVKIITDIFSNKLLNT